MNSSNSKPTKLWDKGIETNKLVEQFTVGRDREMDAFLAPFDVMGTMAHITMLQSIGLLEKSELDTLLAELKKIYAVAEAGKLKIEDDVEDIHSQVELMLTRSLGDMGKKVHSGRSRNDQVLVDMKLYLRHEVKQIFLLVSNLYKTLIALSNKHKDDLMPGYTHLQVAMPSSFGLWFGAYAESLTDDLRLLSAAYRIINQNPLGSAAGYGSSFPLNRTMTTKLLGFSDLSYNVVYAQMGRGKTEQDLSFAMAAIAQTLGRMAMDMCMYNSQDLGFVHIPDEFTTGSSIMPHKANPDVFELMRGYCNKISVLPFELNRITGNLTCGYFRDLQLLKESYLPVFERMQMCLDFMEFILPKIQPREDILKNEMYQPIFTVEALNEMVVQGVPFRDAYKEVGHLVFEGKFHWDKPLNHTHIGSIGNLCNDKIQAQFNSVFKQFEFEKVAQAIAQLTK